MRIPCRFVIMMLVLLLALTGSMLAVMIARSGHQTSAQVANKEGKEQQGIMQESARNQSVFPEQALHEQIWRVLELDDHLQLQELLVGGLDPNMPILSKYWKSRRGPKHRFMHPLIYCSFYCRATNCINVLLDWNVDVLFLDGEAGALPIQKALSIGNTGIVERIVAMSPKMSEIKSNQDILVLIQRISPPEKQEFGFSDIKTFRAIACDEREYLNGHGWDCPCWNPIGIDQYPACILHYTTNGIPYHYKYFRKNTPHDVAIKNGTHPSNSGCISSIVGVPACFPIGMEGIDY